MEYEDDIIYKTVQSHLKRAREGRKLLKEGRSLSEMQIPIEGPDKDSLQEKRMKYIESVKDLDPEKLRWILGNIEHQIERREQTEEVGTSELHWMRIIVRSLVDK